MTKNEIIWNNIDRLRIERGLSKAELAKKAKTRPQALNNIKSGIRGTGPSLLKKFAAALGVAESDLMATTKHVQAPSEQPKQQQASDMNSLIKIVEEQNRRIEEQGKRIDEQGGLIMSQKDLISAQGERITEQGKRIDLIAGMAKASQDANLLLAESVKSIQDLLNKQHEKMITAAKTGDLKALGG